MAAIANAAREYAVKHGGTYPLDLGVLLEEKWIAPKDLHSPYAGTPIAERTAMGPQDHSRGDFLKYVDEHSDYQYFGGDLSGAKILSAMSEWKQGPQIASTQDEDAFQKIIVASGKDPIMRVHIAVGFADGRADFVDLEEAEKVVATANDGRARLGFARCGRRSRSAKRWLRRKASRRRKSERRHRLAHTPISSFHRSGFSRTNFSISAMQPAWFKLRSSTPRARNKSSAPRKFLFSPMTTLGIR